VSAGSFNRARYLSMRSIVAAHGVDCNGYHLVPVVLPVMASL
jgi:hypothetical protein